MKLKDLMRELEKKYPISLAEEWDNVGLLIGDEEKIIERVLLALDVTHEVIDYAKKEKIDLIITHHPLIFQPVKKLQLKDNTAEKIMSLVKADISLYTLHTNLDVQLGGLNDYLLKKIGILKSSILDKREDGIGIGRVFCFEQTKSIGEIITLLQEKLNLNFLRIIGDNTKKEIKKICFVNGSGMSYWKLAKSKKIDLFITGDISYHDALDLSESGMLALDIGHLEAERFFSELLLQDLGRFSFSCYVFEDKPVFQVAIK